ncbi:MAG: DUF3570 domain-containing protein [Polyangiaceae bacterium]|nr:DUF3570 domain-containing protein [Polyangiaceae bacterium]
MRFRFLAILVTLLVAAAPLSVRAASNDKEVTELLTGTLTDEASIAANPDAALETLAFAKQACEGASCSPKVRAKVYIAIGTVLAIGKKKPGEAKEAFVLALKEDPTATLFPNLQGADVQKAFDEARKVGNASTGTAQVPKADGGAGTPKVRKEYPGNVKPARGWKTGEGYFYYQEAVSAEGSRDWADCAAYAQASLTAENRVTTRYLAASCEERAGLWIEAYGDYNIVADTGQATGLGNVARQARAKAEELSQKIPKIIIRKPAKATGLVVKLNNVVIENEKLGGEIWVNPGQRTVFAKGRVDGVDGEFEQVVDVAEFESVSVDIKLLPPGARLKDATVLKCMAEAKTPDEFARCVGSGGNKGNLNYTVGFELSGYHDSNFTDVVTPALVGKVESVTGGWGANASFLVDVVTTASADIIANASPRWTEVRYVPAIGGHKKIGDIDVSIGGGASIEPDYVSAGGSIGASIDLRQKTVTPALNYGFGYDISGRAGTSYSVFGRPITRHSVDASITFVVDKATFFTPSLTAVFENGDSSKPYRYIPMFSEDLAQQIQGLPGLTPEAVNTYRLGIRPLEQLPLSRQRYALAARIAHRFSSSTIRAEERVYADSWGLIASTTDARFIFDATKDLRAWPHLRLHVQDGVDFWKIAYIAEQTSKGLVVPFYRTGDRELGPMVGLTLGAGARLAFGKEKNWGLSATFDFVYTRFLDHLYILQRFGYFGATNLAVELD